MDSTRIKPWMGVIAVGVVAVVVAVGLLALGAVQPASARAKLTHPAVKATQQVTMAVFRGKIEDRPGIKGPDGKTHDTVVPANIVVKKGVPVRLVITNYDESPHTITAPMLGLNIVIRPGKEHEAKGEEKETGKERETITPTVTTVTFTPKKAGIYRWYCALPCDKGANYWAMGQGYSGMGKEGFMAGFIVVLSA